MANIKSAKKRILTISKKTEQNKARKSAMKTAVKGVLAEVNAENADLANKKLQDASRLINKTASKGTIHKNKAARIISRMSKKVNALGK